MRIIPLKETLSNDWGRRMVRLRRRFRVSASDLRNGISWHLLGGRRFFDCYWREMARSHRWVFIIGCNNSGTSLLQRLLELTGGVSTFAAEGQLYTRAVRRDRKRGYSRVWSEYLEELRLGRADSLRQAPRLVHDWMNNLPRPIRPVIVEKTPANAARTEWLQKVFPNACFIGLVRNGYAVSEGIRRKAQQPIDSGARHWSAVNRLMLTTAAGLDRYLEVRYEELADRPAATMSRICEFIGIDNGMAEGAAGRGESQARDAMTTVFGPVHNCNQETIERLSNVDISIITAQAGEMLDFFGYTPYITVPVR